MNRRIESKICFLSRKWLTSALTKKKMWIDATVDVAIDDNADVGVKFDSDVDVGLYYNNGPLGTVLKNRRYPKNLKYW